MTVPSGSSAEGYSLDGWDGVIFGATGGISNLQNLSQAAVMAAKQALIEGNEILQLVLGLVFDGLRDGISYALAIIEAIGVKLFGLIPGFTSVEDAINALYEVPILGDIVEALTGVVNGTIADIQTWSAGLPSIVDLILGLGGTGTTLTDLNTVLGGVSDAVGDVAALIAGIGGTVITDVSSAINGAVSDVATALSDISSLVSGVGGTIIGDVATAINDAFSTATTAATDAGDALGQLVDIISGAGEATAAAVGSAINGAVSDATSAVTDIGSLLSQTAQATATDLGNFIADASSDATSAVDQFTDIVSNALGGAATAVTSSGTAFQGMLTNWYNSWTGAGSSRAASSDMSAAAAAAALAAAAAAAQTAAIQAQLPHFYGGSGTSGINVQISFSGSLPSSFTSVSTIAANSAKYNVSAANTDEETVSGIWSASIQGGGERYLFLRANTGFTTYCYAKIAYVTSPSTFTIEIGCVVSGVKTALSTYTDSGLSALTTAIHSANSLITLQATDYTLTVNYPGLSAISFTDSSHVSQKGSSYRNAGYGTSESLPGSILSWSFYDSGPTAGPASAVVSTSEGTGSTSYTDLATTTDQITVNVGSSGLLIVFIKSLLVNATLSQSAIMSFALSGANTQAASDSYCIRAQTGSNAGTSACGAPYLLTGLTPGATTVKLKYKSSGGSSTATFSDRHVAAIPL